MCVFLGVVLFATRPRRSYNLSGAKAGRMLPLGSAALYLPNLPHQQADTHTCTHRPLVFAFQQKILFFFQFIGKFYILRHSRSVYAFVCARGTLVNTARGISKQQNGGMPSRFERFTCSSFVSFFKVLEV